MTDSDIAAHSQAHVIECALKQIRLSEGEPLSIGSLSEAAGVTPPVLNKAFHSYFGVNVNGFLRLRNLRAVRAALIKADPLQDTVSAVVHRCGMANTDRFEDNYRRLFGESPARTLQLSAEHAARRDMSWLACAAQIFLADALLPGSLLQSAVVTPRCPTSEGVLVEAVAIPWLELVAQLERDPRLCHQIHWRTWEEIVAGAYDRQGYEVTLTPRSNDGGRDIIAVHADFGSVRISSKSKPSPPATS